MSYYILTSDLNLGNILSTESISPASLYGMRNHGFTSIETVWDFENAGFIQLRSQLPASPAAIDGVTAMVLELDESLVGDVQLDDSGAMWTAETIRITPAKCKFIFYSQEDLNAAFNGVQRSIEAKFSERYKSRAKVKAAGGKKAPTLFDGFEESKLAIGSGSIEDIARFEMIDRFKGAIFGYCLGDDISLAKSVRADFADFMVVVDEMVNAVTQLPLDSLEGSRREIESLLYKFALRNELEDMESSDRTSFSLNERLDAIKKLSAVELPLGMRNDAYKLNAYRSDLEGRMRKAAGKRSRSFGRPKVVVDSNRPTLSLPDKDGGLAAHLINELIGTDVLVSTNGALGYPFALQCGKMAREYLGDSWENSGERAYINKLLPHLNVGDDFDYEDGYGIEDEKALETLKLVARFCERPDNKELDSFYRYLLIKCQVTDFSLAFALWGAAFGFSEMPKTLCNAMSPTAENAARKLFGQVLALMNS